MRRITYVINLSEVFSIHQYAPVSMPWHTDVSQEELYSQSSGFRTFSESGLSTRKIQYTSGAIWKCGKEALLHCHDYPGWEERDRMLMAIGSCVQMINEWQSDIMHTIASFLPIFHPN